MLKSLSIKGFRCFREIHVEPLQRVNLIVGLNNAGKTSLLDAIEVLTLGVVEGLVRSSVRRDEKITFRYEEADEFKDHRIDAHHLFFGHELHDGVSLRIEGLGAEKYWVKGEIARVFNEKNHTRVLTFESHLTTQTKRHGVYILSPAGGVPRPGPVPETDSPVRFLAAESSINIARVGQLWDALVLTPQEDEVLGFLRLIEPKLEGLAFLAEERGIVIKLQGARLPLGTLGGGIKHLLALALNALSARNGFLLVDEIDTGLHYSLMVDLWRLVVEMATRLNIQVFATTHSLDCVRALARLQRQSPDLAAAVAVHRVEKHAPRTVVYDAEEVAVAAEGYIEVR
jgi:hypothetical protein